MKKELFIASGLITSSRHILAEVESLVGEDEALILAMIKQAEETLATCALYCQRKARRN